MWKVTSKLTHLGKVAAIYVASSMTNEKSKKENKGKNHVKLQILISQVVSISLNTYLGKLEQ